jgi:hypothetical protein
MTAVILFTIAIPAVTIGTIAHFSILSRLEQSGFKVKYFAMAWESVRAYKTYAAVAREKHWSTWALYGLVAGIVGLVCGGIGMVLSLAVIQSWIK